MKMSGEHWVREVLKTRVTENFRDGGGGVPPFSANFFPLTFWQAAFRDVGEGDTPIFR